MASHHAVPGEIVDLASWADDLPRDHSKAIFKTDGLEVARLVIKSGSEMHRSGYCKVSGPIVIQCIEGRIELKTPDGQISISAGQLVYLEGQTEHALAGVLDSIVLLTIVLIRSKP